MSREERNWHPDFMKYMEFIVSHPNYKGLPIERKQDGTLAWVKTAQSEIGKARKKWCEQKAIELNIPLEPGVYANVMREIHPTGWKVCQTCGRKMSIYYHYPSSALLNALKKTFGYDFSEVDHISDIWDFLISEGISDLTLKNFLISKIGLPNSSLQLDKQSIISQCEYICRTQGKKMLSPGAMSNFPDRYDGFHTYNRCCRASQDTGRSAENLKSYTKDRRAYEYWSDGNIQAANNFMGSSFFYGTTADHIGPISLGFVHDPRYIQPMDGSDNSSKRDRLQLVDIQKIIEVENRTGVYPMSWYSKLIWEYIKENYKLYPERIEGLYRDALKQNMSNFMFILWVILDKCGEQGEIALEKIYLEPNYKYFNYSYEFNELGEIINRLPRHFTERNQNETERYKRIAFQAVYDYNDKSNRNTKPMLDQNDLNQLLTICNGINSLDPFKTTKESLKNLLIDIQTKIIFKIS